MDRVQKTKVCLFKKTIEVSSAIYWRIFSFAVIYHCHNSYHTLDLIVFMLYRKPVSWYLSHAGREVLVLGNAKLAAWKGLHLKKTKKTPPNTCLIHFLFVFNKVRLHFQSKKSYEQRCKEADEAELAAVKIGQAAAATATPKQTEKVHWKCSPTLL